MLTISDLVAPGPLEIHTAAKMATLTGFSINIVAASGVTVTVLASAHTSTIVPQLKAP